MKLEPYKGRGYEEIVKRLDNLVKRSIILAYNISPTGDLTWQNRDGKWLNSEAILYCL